MKAVVYENYGAPDVFQIKDVEKPIPKDNEVLIKIYAASVSARDVRIRSFTVPPSYWLFARLLFGLRGPKRKILGSELAGEIESVGKDVKLFNRGDQVFGSAGIGFGAYAEYICIPEERALAVKPSNLTYEEAVAIPFGGFTSLYFLRSGNIQVGKKILINGASGSVGTSAVQLAKHFGAEVTGVCSATNSELVKSLGADKVIDYTKEDFTENGEKYDIIFDAVGDSSFSGCIRSLKENGVYLQSVAALLRSVRGLWTSMTTNKKVIGGTGGESAKDLILLKELVETGKVTPVIDRSYPFEQIAEAHRYVDEGHKKGNVVITLKHNNKTQN